MLLSSCASGCYATVLLAQIELKTPVIEQQRRDYERALLSHEQLSTRLEHAMRDSSEKAAQLASLTSKVAELTSDRDILKQEVQDLCTQIRALLAEHARSSKGTVLEMSSDAASLFLAPSASFSEEVKSLAALEPDDVISHNLVSYKDLGELQTRNVQLLRVVRQLSKQRAEELARGAAEAEAAAAAGLKARAVAAVCCFCVCFRPPSCSRVIVAGQNALGELQALRAAREKQEAMVLVIVQQRDMYRALLAQAEQKQAAGSAAGGGPAPDAQAALISAPQGSLPFGSDGTSGLEVVLRSTQDELVRVRADAHTAQVQARDELDQLKKDMSEV